MEFRKFPKIPRLSREMIITEKIDGTNCSVAIDILSGEFLVGSRTRWITPDSDNHGFAQWAYAHKEELAAGLGDGVHYGEWWGSGIQRGYGLKEKRFSLFNVSRWTDDIRPACCCVVPVLYRGEFDTIRIGTELERLKTLGSVAAPGFMNPEGVVVFHVAGNLMLKKTIEKDEFHKGEVV